MESVSQDYKSQNDKEREYFKQDFTEVAKLLSAIRKSLATGEPLSLKGLELANFIKYNPSETLTYITLFQAGTKFIRYGSRRNNFLVTLNRVIEMLRKHKRFSEFDVADENKCRIMLEYMTDRRKTDLKKLNQFYFNDDRFEIGINGLELKFDGTSYYYMPTDAVTMSHMGLAQALNTLAKKTPVAKITDKIFERIKLLEQDKKAEFYLFKSKAFVSYKDKCIPLYRGNVLYDEFDIDTLFNQMKTSVDWLIKNMYDDGRFLYYYDCCDDTRKDHEHPNRSEDNLYYNDLRHCGGIISLVRLYQLTSDEKYIAAAKKALDWSVSITREHDTQWGKGCYAFLNKKAKLGGTGVLLVAMMQYRISTGDASYDEYIKGYARHLLSRICPSGEFLGYYIHPAYNNGEPLIEMNDEERKATFSFYYPGEALLGLALFANNFPDENLVAEVKKMAEKALDWIVDERPKIYADLFTKLPSDAWLMQAIEEWSKNEDFEKENYLAFVFNDARTMIQLTYNRDDSPYIDYEGGYYYDSGDHFYPDGARSEGLVASYYLALRLGWSELAEKLLAACKLTAKCQFLLYNNEVNSYSHKNPAKSIGSIRFKATRQWVRVDSIQHVACFFARLYAALK